jgi:hypothetical protein
MSKAHARLVASNNLSYSLSRKQAAIKKQEEFLALMQKGYDDFWEAAKIPKHLIGRA